MVCYYWGGSLQWDVTGNKHKSACCCHHYLLHKEDWYYKSQNVSDRFCSSEKFSKYNWILDALVRPFDRRGGGNLRWNQHLPCHSKGYFRQCLSFWEIFNSMDRKGSPHWMSHLEHKGFPMFIYRSNVITYRSDQILSGCVVSWVWWRFVCDVRKGKGQRCRQCSLNLTPAILDFLLYSCASNWFFCWVYKTKHIQHIISAEPERKSFPLLCKTETPNTSVPA